LISINFIVEVVALPRKKWKGIWSLEPWV